MTRRCRILLRVLGAVLASVPVWFLLGMCGVVVAQYVCAVLALLGLTALTVAGCVLLAASDDTLVEMIDEIDADEEKGSFLYLQDRVRAVEDRLKSDYGRLWGRMSNIEGVFINYLKDVKPEIERRAPGCGCEGSGSYCRNGATPTGCRVCRGM